MNRWGGEPTVQKKPSVQTSEAEKEGTGIRIRDFQKKDLIGKSNLDRREREKELSRHKARAIRKSRGGEQNIPCNQRKGGG